MKRGARKGTGRRVMMVRTLERIESLVPMRMRDCILKKEKTKKNIPRTKLRRLVRSNLQR